MHDGQLKLRHLASAVAVADTGSMARAAAAMSVSQPVVTRAVQELENILGGPLFDRAVRGVTPTPIGATFVGHARSVMEQIGNATAEVTDLLAGRVGSVRVGTHLAGSTVLLPQAIRLLKESRPKVVVKVVEATPDRLRASLAAAELDLVVGRLVPPLSDALLSSEALYDEPVGLVTRAQHPSQLEDVCELGTLVHYPWILPVEQTGLRSELEALFLAEGLDLPADRIDCNSLPTTRNLLLHSDSIAVVPLLAVHQDPLLAILPTTLEPLRRPVGITFPTAPWQSPNVTAMRECLREAGQGIGAWLSLRTGLPPSPLRRRP